MTRLKKISYSAGSFTPVQPYCLTKPQYDRRLGVAAPSLKYSDTFPAGSDNNTTYVWPVRKPVETKPQWKPQKVAKVNKRQNRRQRVQRPKTRKPKPSSVITVSNKKMDDKKMPSIGSATDVMVTKAMPKEKKRDDPKSGSDLSPDTKESVNFSVEKGEGDKIPTAADAMYGMVPSDEKGKREMPTVASEEIKRDDEVRVGSDHRAVATNKNDKSECESIYSELSTNPDEVSAEDKTEGQKPGQISSEEKWDGDEIPTVTDPMEDEAFTSQLSTNPDEDQKPKQIPSSDREESGKGDKMATDTDPMDDEAFNNKVTTYLNDIFAEAVKVFQKLEKIPSLNNKQGSDELPPATSSMDNKVTVDDELKDDESKPGADSHFETKEGIEEFESKALSSELSTNPDEVSAEDKTEGQKPEQIPSEEKWDGNEVPTVTDPMDDEDFTSQLSTNPDEEQEPKQIPTSDREESGKGDKMPNATDPMEDEVFNSWVTTYLDGIFAEAMKEFQKLEPISSLNKKQESDKLPSATNGMNNKDVYEKLVEVEVLPGKKRNQKIKKRVSRMLKRFNCIKKAEEDDDMAKIKKIEIKENKQKKTTILGNLRKGAERCFARLNRFCQNLAN